MNARLPAEVFAPGDFLKEELEARGWSQAEFADILGRPPRVVSEIISGKRSITPETAQGLASALGTSAQLWMNLETSYQLSKTRGEDQLVKRRAALYSAFPVKEMLKRGWVEHSQSIDVLEKRFLDFFAIKVIEEVPGFAHAAKRNTYTGASILQLAWLNRARQIALATDAGRFTDAGIKTAIEQIKQYREYVDSVRHIPPTLAKAGVRLVVVEQLPGAKMDGACFWLDATKPVIVLSLRYGRLDNFWHTLFHELDHVAHGEGKTFEIVEEVITDTPWDKLPPNERRANDNAANHCVPQIELEGFIARVNPLFSKAQIIGFARRIQVHPALVIGQLQRRGLIPYSFHREFLVSMREPLLASVLADGFKNKLPI